MLLKGGTSHLKVQILPILTGSLPVTVGQPSERILSCTVYLSVGCAVAEGLSEPPVI